MRCAASAAEPAKNGAAAASEAPPQPSETEPAKSGAAAASEPPPPPSETDLKSVIKFAAPALGIFAANPIMTLIDSAFVGSSAGAVGQAALSPCSVVLDFPMLIFSFLSTATTNLISREADRESAVRRVLRLSYFLAILAGSALFLGNTFLAPAALRALGTPAETAAAAMTYINVRRLFIPLVFVSSTSMSSFLALRDPMTPLKWTAVAAAANVALDWLLCVKMPLGMAGAAWATLASQVIMLVGLLGTLYRRKLLPASPLWPLPARAEVLPFAAFAGPVSLLALIRVAGFTALAAHANGLGNAAALAAHQLSVSVLVLLSICGEPLNSTGQTRLPRLFPGGAAPDAAAAAELVLTLVRAAAAVGVASCVIGAAALLLGGRVLAADAEVYAQLVRVVPPYSACLALTATTVVLDGCLVARRDFAFLVPTQAGALAVLVVALGACKSMFPELGLPAIWAAYLIYLAWRAVAYSLRLTHHFRSDAAAAAKNVIQ